MDNSSFCSSINRGIKHRNETTLGRKKGGEGGKGGEGRGEGEKGRRRVSVVGVVGGCVW